MAVEDEIAVGCGLLADMSGCDAPEGTTSYESLSPDRKIMVGDAAVATLRLLTAGVVGNCPVEVRPCSPRCCTPGYTEYGPGWTPTHIGFGVWVNACGCGGDCTCQRSKAIDLGGPVAEVTEVLIDGVALDAADYRLDAGRWLFRTDGGDWPTVQDLNLPTTEADTFAVTLRPGYALDTYGKMMLGRLVCEYSKSMCGKKCALPKNVTSVVRSGVSMEITRGLFHDGLTGIREVDIFIESINPYHLRTLPTIASPDLRR